MAYHVRDVLELGLDFIKVNCFLSLIQLYFEFRVKVFVLDGTLVDFLLHSSSDCFVSHIVELG